MALCTSYTNNSFLKDEHDKKNSIKDSVNDSSKQKGIKMLEIKLNSETASVTPTIENRVTTPLTDKVLRKESTILMVNDDQQYSTENYEDYSLLSYFQFWSNLKKQDVHFANKITKWKQLFFKIIKSLLVFLFIAYFTAVLLIRQSSSKYADEKWCDADGLLIIITSIVFTGLFYFQIFKPYVGHTIFIWGKRKCLASQWIRNLLILRDRWFVSVSIYTIAVGALAIFLIIDTKGDRIRLISAAGILILCLFGFLFSSAPRKVVWRPIIWGIGLQFIMGFVVIRSETGQATFECVGNKVTTFLDITKAGSKFIFGQQLHDMNVFSLRIICIILFFTFCIEILYHYGAMQWTVIKLGWLLEVTVGTTPCESINAVSNIFLGPAAAPLIIRPYIPDMTKSELHAIMTNSFASIASGVMAVYISFGISAAHLISASVMSAPAALACSKLFYPEIEISKTNADNIKIIKGDSVNVLHAAIDGVIRAIPVAANILANILAIISFIAFVDAIFNWACVLVDIDDGICTLSNIFGYLFMPLAWIMGVPWHDCYYVGQLLGTKTILNEFIGYINLSEYAKEKLISKRAEIISTYALCGFSNIGAIGIQVGSLKAIAPIRMREIATLAIRAMVAGSFACFLTACVAGTLITEDHQLTNSVQNSTI